jgi:Family of unknown function (DUF6515)
MLKNKLIAGFLSLAVLAAPQLSYANGGIGINIGDNHHGFWRWHEHPHWGIHVHLLPAGHITLWVGGARYYYYDGLYYTYSSGDYVIVDPPIGAYVRVIPSDFHPVIINGRTYYTDNGVYYILTRRRGYKVVVAPVVYTQPAVVTVPVTVAAQDTFPVNILNSHGGYTTVVIKRSRNGYVGPQGEFYPQFPAVTQLKAMYGK